MNSMYTRPRSTRRGITSLAVLLATGLTLTACQSEPASPDGNEAGEEGSREVTVIVHDSFPNEAFEEAASQATGLDVHVITSGDGGSLANQLVLTKGAPLADLFFGVDHTFASRMLEHNVVEPYVSPLLPPRAATYAVDDEGSLTAIDLGATCFNIDDGWFDEAGITPPVTYEDLLEPEYRDLTVILDPTSSSTGASFLIGTVAHFGEDGYLPYWEALIDNGARIEQGWSEAYYSQFTQGSPDGTKPIVLSYSSSPGYTVTEDGTASTTSALLDTCSSQVEYAGVLAGASNPEGARAVLDFMLSLDFQNTIADTMYVYPIDEAAEIPAEWADFAPLPENPNDLSAQDIGEGRDQWLKDLSEAIGL